MTSDRRSALTFIVLLCSPLMLMGLIYLLHLVDSDVFPLTPLPTHILPDYPPFETATPYYYPESTVLALVPNADLYAGQRLFHARACDACHNLDTTPLVGPGLGGISQRVPQHYTSLEVDVLRSIVLPSEYLVPGFSDVMPFTYGNQLRQEELADLIAFVSDLSEFQPIGDSMPSSLPQGDPDRGAALYFGHTLGLNGDSLDCVACHSLSDYETIAPSLKGISKHYPSKQTLEAFLTEWILDPNSKLTEEHKWDMTMPTHYRHVMSPEMLADLIAFLMTQ